MEGERSRETGEEDGMEWIASAAALSVGLGEDVVAAREREHLAIATTGAVHPRPERG